MLKLLRKLKNNTGGYILVYVVLLIAFVTCLFAGMAAMIGSRTKITSHNISGQQLQITAQSALNTIVDEFENNAELKAKLAEYVQGSGQTANFKLTNDTGISDDIKVKITKVEGEQNKARIEVEASNSSNTSAVSVAYAIIDYSEPPKGESAGVVDNLIVAFLPANTIQNTDGILGTDKGGQNLLCFSTSGQFYKKKLEGKIVVNNYGKDPIVINNAGVDDCSLESILASGDLEVKEGNVWATSEDIDGKIASVFGSVTLSNSAAVKGKGINLIAGKEGYFQKTDNFVWTNPDVRIMTGDGGKVEIKALVGEIGSITAGGKMDITHKETDNLTINGDVIGMKDVTWNKTGNNNMITTIKGSILSGEDLKLKVNNRTNVAYDIAAVGSVTDGGSSEAAWISAQNVYAGRKIEFNKLNSFSASTLLSGANYRNGDGGSTKSSYTSGGTNKGGIVLKGSNIVYDSAIVNQSNGTGNIDGTSGTIYTRDVTDDFDSKFESANSTWRSLMLKVEKGADSEGYINLAAALRPTEVSGTPLTAFTNLMDPEDGYYSVGGTNVSHHSKYTVNKSVNVLNSVINPEFAKLEEEFKQSIPDMEKTPDVVIPEDLKSQWAGVIVDGNTIEVKRSGYIQVNCTSSCGDNLTVTAIDYGTSEKQTFSLSRGANMVFDTTNEASYDLVVGTKDIDNGEYNNNTDICYFPFNISVKQPKEKPGYVRFFIPDGETFYASETSGTSYDVVNTGESAADGAIPEVYLFYNGTNPIRFKGRYAKGFIIAPHCIVNLCDTPVDWTTRKAFEGLIICGNVSVANNADSARMVYYKPLTYKTAITTDVYKYN